MPTRIVREGIITSEPVNSLSPEAEIFYRRLMSVADDYGRYYSHPALLCGACYPLQLDRITDKNVSKSLAECMAVKLIWTYGDGKYLQVVKFNQQTRSKSKFPEPTEEELLINSESNGNQMITGSNKGRAAPNTTPPSVKERASSLEEIEEYILSLGLPESDGQWIWDKWNGCGWKNNGESIKDWKSTIRSWKHNGYMASQKLRGQTNGNRFSGQPPQKPDYSKGF